jgi:hypothetical protein
LKKYVYFILLILFASMLAVGCTGSNSEKTASQESSTPSKDQAASQQPSSSATSQESSTPSKDQAASQQPSSSLTSQESSTPYKDQVASQQPSSSVTSQDAEWKASVQTQYSILKTDFDGMANDTNNYQDLNNSNADVIGKYGQKVLDDAQKAIEENDKYTVSSKFQDAQTQWRLALKDCKYAGQFWVQSVDDIKNGNTTSANIIKAEATTGSGTYNMQRVIASLESA